MLSDIDKINQFGNLLSFQKTWDMARFMTLPHKIIAAFTGNQWGKTARFTINYVYRIMSWHPIPTKNILYFKCPHYEEHDWVIKRLDTDFELPVFQKGLYNVKTLPKDVKCEVCGEKLDIHRRKSTIFRFCSETLPGQKETVGGDEGQSTEVKNTVYPEFKKWLPAFLIKKDITARNTAMTIYNPYRNYEWGHLKYDGPDIVVDYVSYSQSSQSGAGVQRASILCDEEPPMPFWEEQLPRLLAEDGDIMLALTPAHHMSWTYDSIYERAKLYVRTQSIVDYLRKTSEEHKDVKRIEVTNSRENIAVIMAATDDNPILKKETIEETYMWDDEDTIATRRYGIHRQSSGRIFNVQPCVRIKKDEWFNEIPSEWVHGRSIDFHERNPWAIVWACISQYNEVFIYHEWSPSPLKWVNLTIAQEIADMSGLQRFSLDLIDPLANKVQTNTGTTTVQDLNDAFITLKREGICRGANWEPFDTKGLKGRDEIRQRLKNSSLVGKPFNNKTLRDGKEIYLPTLWITDNCGEVYKSLKQWRYEDWSESRDIVSKDRKETPTQKFSHYCTALEGLMKDIRFRPRVIMRNPGGQRHYKYFER